MCIRDRCLGRWDKKEQILEIHTNEIKTSYIPQRYSGSNRIPILMIGALLGRTNNDIIVPTAGGDLIGSRPVNFHVESLRTLGAEIEFREMKKEGAYFAQAHSGLKGSIITLNYPSVGATENTICLLYTSPSPRDRTRSRMPSSA